MKKFYLFIFLICILTLPANAEANISKPRIDWQLVPPKTIVDVLLSMRFEKVELDNQNLFQTLKEISKSSAIYFGKGTDFNIIINHQPFKYSKEEIQSLDNIKVNEKYYDITLRDILKNLADVTKTSIKLTEYGCIVLYGDEIWRNAPSSLPPYKEGSGKLFNP